MLSVKQQSNIFALVGTLLFIILLFFLPLFNINKDEAEVLVKNKDSFKIVGLFTQENKNINLQQETSNLDFADFKQESYIEISKQIMQQNHQNTEINEIKTSSSKDQKLNNDLEQTSESSLVSKNDISFNKKNIKNSNEKINTKINTKIKNNSINKKSSDSKVLSNEKNQKQLLIEQNQQTKIQKTTTKSNQESKTQTDEKSMKLSSTSTLNSNANANNDEEIIQDYLSDIVTLVNKHKSYPLIARKRGIVGRCIISITISKGGIITSGFLSKDCGNKILNKSAIEILSKIKFTKVIDDKKLTDDVKINIPIVYELK
jgi:protein TonB